MNTLEAIKTRRSIRSFNAKAVDEKSLKTILDAGACAPNGADVAVHYSVVRNKDVLAKLKEAGIAAMEQEPSYDPFYGAATVVILSAKPHPIGCDLANAACAAENMLLAATDLGIGSIYLLGFVLGLKGNEELKKAAGVPNEHVPLLGVALGYSDEAKVERNVENKNVTFID